MRPLLLSLYLAVACLAIPPNPGFSQGEMGTIQGVLLDSRDQRPLRGVTLRLIGSEVETKTDIKGGFSVTVPAGSYAGIVVNLPMGAGLSLLEAEVNVEPGVTDNLDTIEVFPSAVGVPQGTSPDRATATSPTESTPAGTRFLPWLGVIPLEVPADYGPRGGSAVAVSVDRIFRNSPAGKAGFQPGDFIEMIGDRSVTSAYEMTQLIAASPTDAPIEVTVDRRGELLTLNPWLVPVPEAALVAIRELSSVSGDTFSPDGGMQQSFGPGNSPAHPLVLEGRRQTERGNFKAADRAYEEYLALNPQDGLVYAEYAEMVFHNIQNARGMQLMAQAVKKPGLSPQDKTRLRLIVAQRRLESGNLVTAQQMLLEAKREDPFNPVIDDLLHAIEIIVLQSSGQIPGQPRAVPYNQPGVQVNENQVLVNEILGKIAKELASEE